MSRLKMPPKGQSAAMMAALQAEHASEAPADELQETFVTTNVSSNEAPDHEPTTSPGSHEATESAISASTAAPREDRLVCALDRASQDQLAVVTVRVPSSLNRYMDDFVARVNRLDPKHRYRKQDAVAEAFAAFYADHPMPAAPPGDQLD